ncbi:MAG: glycosyltransferase 87 family protein [Planctomycetota bacterium]
MVAARGVRLAQVVTVVGMAAPLLLVDRGREAWATIACHLTATAGFLVLAAAVLRGTYRPRAAEAFVFAVALGAVSLALTPRLSDDIHRYVFEGRLVCAGVNPYLTPPDAPEVAHLRDASWQCINHKEIPAAYPPAVQLALAVAATVSPTPFGPKLVFALCAFAAFAALWHFLPRLGLPAQHAVLFGWCPLLWLECAGEGHSDALAALATVLALWASTCAWPLLAGGCLGLATASKFLPAVLLPFLARRSRRVWLGFVVVLFAVYAPFVADPRAMFAGALEYTARWRANDSAFAAVHWLTESVMSPWRAGGGYAGWLAGCEVQRLAKLPLALLGVCLLARCWRRQESPERTAFVFFAFFVACAPTLHPWYVVLLLPWLCMRPSLWLLAFTGTVALAYHVLPAFHASGAWHESTAVKVLEYAPFYGGLLWAAGTHA